MMKMITLVTSKLLKKGKMKTIGIRTELKKVLCGVLAIAGFTMVSCVQEMDAPVVPETDVVKKVFTATTEEGTDTRTSISIDAEGNGTVIWNGEELIAVNGVDYKVTDGAGTKTVTFGANVENTEAATAEVYNAIYPNTAYVAEGGLNLGHLKEQSAKNKTFGHGYAVTVATTTDKEMDLKFKNVLSFLRVRFTLAEDAKEEAITIKTVKITAAEDDNLWGTVSSVDYATGVIGPVENGGNSIIYNAGENVLLKKGDVYEAVITLPVNTEGRTLKIEVTGENAWTGTPYIYNVASVTKKYDRNRVTNLTHKITPEEVQYVAEGVIKDNEGIYRISTAEGLQWVATAVNGGRSFKNETLKLANSIDLSSIENWTPIGTEEHSFQGTFDGAGLTISNLTINRPTENYVGLFGNAWVAKAIKNFTIEDAIVAGFNYTAVVLGNGTMDTMSDITVKGNVIVEARGTDIGVIAGAVYADMTNITINVSDGSYLHAEGEAVGAIAGYKPEGTFTSSNLTSNIKVIGECSYVGGIFGLVNTGNTIKNATCTGNVTLRAGIADGNPSLWRAYTVGGIVGSWVNDVTVNDCEFTGEIKSSFNGTPVKKEYFFHDGLVGFIWGVADANILTIDDITYTNHNVNSAAVYNTVFASEANVACALVRGDYDLEANKKFTLENGKSIFMNMGGAAVSGTNTDVETTFSSLFTVKGNMTVVNGTVNYVHTGENMLFSKGTGAFNITAGGVVELNDVVVNTSGTDMNFGAHLNNWGTATLIADNCEFNSTYCGVRVFNSGNDVNNVTITNSTLTGVTRAFWVQSNPDKTELLNIDIFDNNNTFTVTNTETALSGIRYGSNYLDEITGEVITPLTAVEKLNKQIAEGASTITLTKDVVFEEGETLTIPAGKTVTLDLAGYTMSQEMTCTGSYVMVSNNGTLTINDSSDNGTGTIILTDNGDGDSTFGWGSYTVRNNGTLTIDGGTIKNVKRADVAHCAVTLMLYAGKATINGGNIISANYRTIQGFSTPEVIINGGNFEGQVWMHSTCSAEASLTIKGGTFAPRGNDGSSVFLNNDNDIKFAVTGGNFTTKVGCNDATKAGVVGAIKGGYFTEAAKTGGATATLVNDDYAFFANSDETYTWAVQEAVKMTLVPGTGVWKGFRYAAYVWNDGGDAWFDVVDGMVTLPKSAGYNNVIFCAMKTANTENNWDNKTYQTQDMTIKGGDVCGIVANKDKCVGIWSSEYSTDNVYLLVNNNWAEAKARFAAYTFGKSEDWDSMTGTTLYSVAKSSFTSGNDKLIFCRMNPNNTNNNWTNKWNQTGDLKIPTDNSNIYVMTSGSWDAGIWTSVAFE